MIRRISGVLVWLAIVMVMPALGAARAASPAPLVGTDGMVVTAAADASLVGAEILQRGGNAIDAAIAVHFALAVTYPQAGNLGGGGFLLVRMADGTCEALDFRETAPAAATRDMFVDADGVPDAGLSTWSVLGTAVPGSVAGMALAHERYATLPWQDLLAPSIRLAAEGFALDAYSAAHLNLYAARFATHPESHRIFIRTERSWLPGDTLRQVDLGRTLTRVARLGPRDFYEGETAELLIAEIQQGGGVMTLEDLRAYRPRHRVPLAGEYRGCLVYSMPPPSSGGVALLQMLGLLEAAPLREWGPQGTRTCHLLAEAMKRAFADRAEFLGDPEFAPVPVAGLLDPGYLDHRRVSIDTAHATPAMAAGPGLPRGAEDFYRATGDTPGPNLMPSEQGYETTHFSIVDREGNAVAVTTTLNTSYGTGIAVGGAGFLLNNEMDDFAAAPGVPNYYGLVQGEANAVRPFARPLSSMTPVITVCDGDLAFVLGSPGGPRIITSVLQTLINLIDHGMDIQEAIDAPRIHHQWQPDSLELEPHALSEDVQYALRAMGHAIAVREEMGSVQGIAVRPTPDGQRVLEGAADPRRNGCAVGLRAGRIVSRCTAPACR